MYIIKLRTAAALKKLDLIGVFIWKQANPSTSGISLGRDLMLLDNLY